MSNNAIVATDEIETVETPQVEANPSVAATTNTESTEKVTTRSATEKAVDDFIKKQTDAEKPEAAVEQKPDETPAAEAKPPVDDQGREYDPINDRYLDPIKAPVLPLGLRDDWSKLPRKWQEHLKAREVEHERRLNESSQAKKFHEEYSRVLAPYADEFKKHNVKASQHVDGLLKLSYAIESGNPVQRAQILANLIKQYQPDAAALGGFLSGQVPQVAPPLTVPPKSIDSLVNEKVASKEEEAFLAEGNKVKEAFMADPKNEWAEDVRELMGKALNSDLVGGNTWPEVFQNAYDFAVANHPEIQKILKSRASPPAQQAQQQAPAAQQPQKKPVASIKPSLGSATRQPAAPKQFKTTREAAEWAFEQHARGE